MTQACVETDLPIQAPLGNGALRRWQSFKRVLLSLAAPCLVALPVHSQELLNLSLEELGGLTVTSVSKREEPLSRAAAAVYVITAANIKESGARSLPEALRLVPGLFVAQSDAANWAVSSRGFTSLVADKLEVILDGRVLYSPLFSGVFWDEQGLLLDDIERIEIIRGPGATLWGANAVNGVINIVTRSAARTTGTLISASGGDFQRGRMDLRWGTALPKGGMRLWATGHGFSATAPEFADPDQVDPGDAWHRYQAGLRADYGGWIVTAQGHQGSKDTALGGLDFSGLAFSARYDFGRGELKDHHLQIYYDQNTRDAQNGFAAELDTLDAEYRQDRQFGENLATIWGLGVRVSTDKLRNTESISFDPDHKRLNLFHAYVQGRWETGPRSAVIFGTKFDHHTYDGVNWQPTLRVALYPNSETTLWAALSRAVRLPSRLDRESFQLGAGGEGSDAGGVANQFNGEVDNTFGDGPVSYTECREAGGSISQCALFANVATRPRTEQQCLDEGFPNAFCQIAYEEGAGPDLLGNPDFVSEKAHALELGWRQQFSAQWAVDFAGFLNYYTDLRGVQQGEASSVTVDDPELSINTGTEEPDSVISNAFEGLGWGAEFELQWTPTPQTGWQLAYSYLGLRLENQPGQNDPSAQRISERDPQHMAHLKGHWQAGALRLSLGLRHIAEQRASAVEAYTELDLGLNYTLGPGLDLRLYGFNLLHDQHQEYNAGTSRQIPRSFSAGLRWSLQ